MNLRGLLMKAFMVMATVFTIGFTGLSANAFAGCGGCNVPSCGCITHLGHRLSSQRESCWYDEATKSGCNGHSWKKMSNDKVCSICNLQYHVDENGQHCEQWHCNICGANMYTRYACGGAAETPAIPAPVYYNFTLHANNNMYITSDLAGTVDNGTMAADRKSVSYTREAGYAVPKTVPVPTGVAFGWHFKGYFSNADSSAEPEWFKNETTGFPLTGNINAYAHYERNKYTVVYDGNYPSGKAVDNPRNISCFYYFDRDYTGDRSKIDYAKGISKPISTSRDLIGDPVYGVHGYIWNGWWTSPGDGEGVRVTTWEQLRDLQSDEVLGNPNNPTIRIYAHWSKSDGDVYLHDDGSYVFNTDLGTTDSKKPYATVDYLDSIYAPLMPLKVYYVYFDGNGGTPSATTVKADRVFSYWKELSPFNMLFNNTSRLITNKQPLTRQETHLDAVYATKAITLPSATRDGLYAMDGWYTQDGKLVGKPGTSYIPDGTETLVAHWTKLNFALQSTAHQDSLGNTPSG